jgi:hypothetical protein
MDLKNLTPHAICLHLPNGDVVSLPSVGVARVSALPRKAAVVAGLPLPVLPAPVWGAVEGLPAPQEGVVFIVSGMVLEALRGSGRSDVFAPGTGPTDGAVRNDKGQVVGVTTLVACG